MSALQKSILKSRLPAMAPSSRSSKRMTLKKRDYTPVEWNQYFEKCMDVKVGTNSFRVYLRGSSGPVLVLLHGGGLSALGWSLFSVSVTGMVKCRIMAIDLRGHGSTKTDDDFNLSSETLSKDVGDVIKEMYGDDPPPIILMGHSMGGAIAVHTAYNNYVPSLIGLVVIDVVEGTALEALSSMQSFLRGRPKTFTSLENAIEWCVCPGVAKSYEFDAKTVLYDIFNTHPVKTTTKLTRAKTCCGHRRGCHHSPRETMNLTFVRSAQVRNIESAKVSMPGQIINCETGELAINDINNSVSNDNTPVPVSNPNQILEEGTESEQTQSADNFKTPQETPKARYKWRIDLTKTEAHWPGWFKGLSSLFLNCSVPKLLLLAGIETLDRELTVGQMQGKFQMQVLPQCGHAVHEDKPEKVAEVLASYMVRFKFAESTGEFHRPFPGC